MNTVILLKVRKNQLVLQKGISHENGRHENSPGYREGVPSIIPKHLRGDNPGKEKSLQRLHQLSHQEGKKRRESSQGRGADSL